MVRPRPGFHRAALGLGLGGIGYYVDYARDKGTALPDSLTSLLGKFKLDSGQEGRCVLDLGAIEFDPANPDAPFEIMVGPSSGDSGAGAAPRWDDGDGNSPQHRLPRAPSRPRVGQRTTADACVGQRRAGDERRWGWRS